jgi:hypothetical protein
VRIDIGPNRETEAIGVEMRRANEATGLTPPPANVIAKDLRGMTRLYGSADFEILAYRADELGLDSTQTDTITRIVNRYTVAHDSVYAALGAYLSAHGNSFRDRQARTYWHDAIANAIRQNYATALELRKVLRPEQIVWLRSKGQTWVDYTPEWLRNALRKPLMPQ